MNPQLNLVIAYLNEAGKVSIIYPMSDCGLSVAEIAEKDVPFGRPYVFLPGEIVPEDHTFFDAFEVDFTFPSGHGVGPEGWFANRVNV